MFKPGLNHKHTTGLCKRWARRRWVKPDLSLLQMNMIKKGSFSFLTCQLQFQPLFFCYFPFWFSIKGEQTNLCTLLNVSKKKLLVFSSSGPSVCADGSVPVISARVAQPGQTQTGDDSTAAFPEISGADVTFSISVSEWSCEMVGALGHRAGQSAHTGRGWSITHGPLVGSRSCWHHDLGIHSWCHAESGHVRGLRCYLQR